MTVAVPSTDLQSSFAFLLEALELAVEAGDGAFAASLAAQLGRQAHTGPVDASELARWRELQDVLHRRSPPVAAPAAPRGGHAPAPETRAAETARGPDITLDRLDRETADALKTIAFEDATVYPVWFGTNRKPHDPDDLSRGFGHERASQTFCGRVDVRVPEAHRFGETGNSWFRRLRRFELRDDRLRIQRLVPCEAAQLWRELQRAMAEAARDGDAPEALIYLHGYKNSFADAAIRAAQIGVDLKVPGATASSAGPRGA